MPGQTVALRRLDNFIWALVAAVAAIVLIVCATTRFQIVFGSYTAAAGAGTLLLGAAYFYRNHRADLKLASALEITAQVLIFAAVAAPPSYFAASSALPLRDATRRHGSVTWL